jgi:hypothetical protein
LEEAKNHTPKQEEVDIEKIKQCVELLFGRRLVMIEIIIYVLAVALIAFLPWILDILLAYYSKNKTWKFLADKASVNGLNLKELQELAKEISKPPPGISGLSRASMALTVIMVLAVAMVHILVVGCGTNDSQVVNNILSMLSGLLAAITGFYFGGRSTEKATEQERKGSADARSNIGKDS